MMDQADDDLLGGPGKGLRPVSELVDATMNRIICRLIGKRVRAATVSELVDATMNRIICRLIGKRVRAAMIREARQAGWPGFRR